jgi:hypothetical protein
MADMGAVVDGHAANVHADLALDERDEVFELAGQRVVDSERHGLRIGG